MNNRLEEINHPKVSYGKTGVLLVNLGPPDSTSWLDIRKYLKEFLSDRRGIRLLGVGFYNLKSLEKDQLKLEDFYEESENMNSYELLDEFMSEKNYNKKTEDVKMKDLSDFD